MIGGKESIEAFLGVAARLSARNDYGVTSTHSRRTDWDACPIYVRNGHQQSCDFKILLHMNSVFPLSRLKTSLPKPSYSSRNMVTALATIHPGILNLPGATPQSKALVEQLLEEDREKFHCFWGRIGLHNHLSHQSAYLV